MTHATDGFRAGAASFANFIGVDANPLISANTIPPQGLGAAMSIIYAYVVVPLTMATNNIATTQTPAGAGVLTLTAGTGTTAGTVGGNAVIILDVARAVRVTSAGNDSAHTFLVAGYDIWGQFQSELITGPNATTVTGKKTFLKIISVTISAAATGAITIGTSDTFGMPYVFKDKGLLVVKWNNTLAADAATVVVADATTPATTTTGDVRGTVLPSSASDGSKRLIVNIDILDPDTQVGLYGVAPV